MAENPHTRRRPYGGIRVWESLVPEPLLKLVTREHSDTGVEGPTCKLGICYLPHWVVVRFKLNECMESIKMLIILYRIKVVSS